MTTTLIVTVYLMIGALMATGYAVFIKRTTDPDDPWSQDEGVRDATQENERAVSGFPGGMPAVLIMMTLIWPVAVAFFIRQGGKR
jgi:hypothetical protein